MENLLQYYGLDWLALVMGLSGSWLIGSMNRYGFFFSICACLCGFSVAIMAHQYGFVLYNVILISFATRGYIRWGREKRMQTSMSVAAE